MKPQRLTERPHQYRGSRLARWLLAQLGWTLHFDGLPARQGVIAVYPHTSNFDFIVGILAKWAMGIDANFWGKDTLFRIPLLGPWMRWLGGIPVNRSAPGGLVEQAAEHLRRCRDEDRYAWLVVAPEGTRRRTEGWRSGFYRVAVRAGVPLGVAAIDYGRREIRLNQFISLCGQADDDMAEIAAALEAPQGYHHHQSSPIRLA